MSDPSRPSEEYICGDPAVELSSNRTSLSFERTRLSADRTLMSSVRTALSLITFGFTVNEVFQQFEAIHNAPLARYFALALVVLGTCLLVLGLYGHRRFMKEVVRRKERLHGMGLVRRAAEYQPTATFITAFVLLLLGVAATVSIVWRSFLS